MKAIIFDMDGLMVDSESISYRCFKKFLSLYDIPFDMELYLKDYPGKPLKASICFIKDTYQLDFDIDEAIQFFHNSEESIVNDEGVPLKKGLKELLDYLKTHGYQMIIASSSGRERIEKFVSSDILNYFEGMVCGPEVKHGKPAPDIFLKACEKLGVNTDEAIVLEDSENGIQAAYEAHIPVICIPDMKYPAQSYLDKCVAVMESLNDVIDYLDIT